VDPPGGDVGGNENRAPTVRERASARSRFGFISREAGDNIFVHYSNIVGDGHKTLAEGDVVEFETAPRRKGEEARNVRRA
jgi:CspA family cold shock protein